MAAKAKRDEPAAEWVAIDRLKPWPGNPRSDQPVEEVAASLKRFGWGAPIVARREDGEIIAGHTRWQAARLNGDAKVPVRWVDLSADEAHALALADNKLAELAAWTSEGLRDVMIGLADSDIDVSGLGWDEAALKAMLEPVHVSEHDRARGVIPDRPEDDQQPEAVEPKAKPGGVYEIGRHRVLCGDCVEIMAAMDESSIDAIVCDPPYGIGFMSSEWDVSVPGPAWAAACLRVLKPGGHIIAFAATRTVHRLGVTLEDAGFEIRDMIAWLQWQGFPKNLDVSKAIDRGMRREDAAEDYVWSPSSGPTEDVYAVTAFVRAARDAGRVTNREIDELFGFNGMAGHWTTTASQPSIPTWPQWLALKEFLGMTDERDELVIRLNGGSSIEGTALADRKVIGQGEGFDPADGFFTPGVSKRAKTYDVTAPATGAASFWAGWGTALKPSQEPAILARKPIPGGTVAANVLKHGVGALNIDGCRYAYGDKAWPGPSEEMEDAVWSQPAQPEAPSGARANQDRRSVLVPAPAGRWPANLYHCPKPATREKEAGSVARYVLRDDIDAETRATIIEELRQAQIPEARIEALMRHS